MKKDTHSKDYRLVVLRIVLAIIPFLLDLLSKQIKLSNGKMAMNILVQIGYFRQITSILYRSKNPC